MPPGSPSLVPDCHLTIGPNVPFNLVDSDGNLNTYGEDTPTPRPCSGARCSAWRPQVRVTIRPHGKGRKPRVLTALWNPGLPSMLGHYALSIEETGLGVCGLMPDRPPFPDPAAPPKEPDHA